MTQQHAGGNPDDSELESARGRVRTREAMKLLEEHIKRRGPYVQLASSRLQAAMRMCNDLLFELPQVHNAPKTTPGPKDMRRASEGMVIASDDGAKTKFKARGRSSVRGGGKVTKKPLKMCNVNPETGNGLRGFLLTKGFQTGHKEISCKSISIHDFTPDMKTGVHQNTLLGHYDTGTFASVSSYQVDL
jgi:hypothetical protein